ncbi:MAG: DUF305 domain-containing protein [Herminiimonas sp.]|nr:DUF305 domain-containing protein [Herminiimonas sp.]
MRSSSRRSATAFAVAVIGLGILRSVVASEPAMSGHHHAATTAAAPPAFVASREKPYGALVDDAMAIMNDGMARAPMNGNADHDFAAMMIPHHEGAVDMAKAELLYGTNPVLRRLAQEIIVTQGQEIQVMQLELNKTSAAASASH